jgi:hypothetical protein
MVCSTTDVWKISLYIQLITVSEPLHLYVHSLQLGCSFFTLLMHSESYCWWADWLHSTSHDLSSKGSRFEHRLEQPVVTSLSTCLSEKTSGLNLSQGTVVVSFPVVSCDLLRSVVEVFGFGAVCVGRSMPTFRRNILSPSSGAEVTRQRALYFPALSFQSPKMETACFPKRRYDLQIHTAPKPKASTTWL